MLKTEANGILLLILVLASSLLAINAYAQNSIRVVDAVTNQPVPYAFCSLKNGTWGVSADASGIIDRTGITEKDSVYISSIGYKSFVGILPLATEFFLLTPVVEMLEEVLVKPKEEKLLSTGKLRKKDLAFGYAANIIPWRQARYFAFEDVNNEFPFIKKISLSASSRIENAQFTVQLIEADSNKRPSNIKMTEPLVVTIQKGQKMLVEIPIVNPVTVPEHGYFVVLSWIYLDKHIYVYETTMMNDPENFKFSTYRYEPIFLTKTTEYPSIQYYYTDKNEWLPVRGLEFEGQIKTELAIEVIYSN
jgi:hypothetical protein